MPKYDLFRVEVQAHRQKRGDWYIDLTFRHYWVWLVSLTVLVCLPGIWLVTARYRSVVTAQGTITRVLAIDTGAADRILTGTPTVIGVIELTREVAHRIDLEVPVEVAFKINGTGVNVNGVGQIFKLVETSGAQNHNGGQLLLQITSHQLPANLSTSHAIHFKAFLHTKEESLVSLSR